MSLIPIPRPSRLRAVWLTYRTQLRWWSWPLALGLVVFLLWGAYLGWRPKMNQLPQLGQEKITEKGPDGTEVIRYVSKIIGHTPVRALDSGLPSDPMPWPHAVVRLRDDGSVDGSEPKWGKLRSLRLDRGWAKCKPLWTDGALPLLESLVVWDTVQDASIIRLCEMYDLKSLVLVHAGDLTATAMERLSREPRLEFLSLDVSRTSYDFPPLPGENPLAVQQRAEKKTKTLRHAPVVVWPATLKTLRFYDEPGGATLARLKEWQQLPQLSCLVTRLNPVEGNRLDDEAVAVLQRFPKLKQLYLRDPTQGESDFGIEQQRRLPQFTVRPMHYDPTRGKRAIVILASGMVVGLLLLFVLIKQFVTVANRLQPHFARSHLTIPAGVIAVQAVTSFFLYRLADCPALVGLGLCAASVAVIAVGVKLFRSVIGITGLQLLVNPAMLSPAVIVPLVCAQLVLSFYGAEIDWFLRGQYAWWPLVVLAVSLWGACDLAAWLRGLSRDLEEGGCANVPLGTLDAAGWTEWGKSVMAVKATGREKAPMGQRRQERRLDQLERDLAAGKKFTPEQLWRFGIMMTMFDWLITFVPIFLLFLIPLGLLVYSIEGSPFSQPAFQLNKVMWPFAIQIVVMSLVVPMATLSQRYPMLALERLRPATREDWTKTWFRGVLRELTPLPVMLLGGTVALYWSGVFPELTLSQTLLFVGLLVSAASVLIALAMLATTLRSRWWLAGFVVLTVATVPGAVSILSELQFGTGQHDLMIALVAVGLLLVTTCLLWRLAQWRWREWELALTEK